MTSSMRPIQPESHRLDMNGMSSMPAGNESTPTVFERSTKGGRRLRYQLTILQQPERARACGSGSKSAADRRPVDPPPVVELLIFDITHGDAKDITFSYNVNFFLFATLEHARPMVHGRVQTSASASPPVLTGMPVSGMAYLDRPSVAGYFLFPDLSVRHEGRYRLAFNLYEEIKEDADADAEPTEISSDVNDNPAFDWRMEIKSNPFTVYSAKKFPGLTESTVLSRTVADQGCRVRIRRDVRMRRREVKGGDNGRSSNRDRREPALEQRVSRTPDRQPVDQYRARSGSSHSIHSDHGRVAPVMPPAMPPQGYQQEPQRKISISSEYQTPSHPPVHSPYNGPAVPYSYAPPAGPSHHVPQSPSHAHPAYGHSPSPYSSYNNNNNANTSSRPSTQGYDRHNSVSSSYAPLEIDPKHERHPSVSHSVPPSPSTRYPIEHDRRPSYGHPSHVPPPPLPAPQHPPHLSYNEPTLRLPPIRDSVNLSNNIPNIPPTAPPSYTSKFINSYIEPDTDPAPPILPSLSLGAGHKRIRDPSPSDSRRYHNGARHDPGSVPTYTPSPYLSQREGSSFYMQGAPRYTREYHFTSADGYAKSIPHNQFFDC